MKGFGVRAVLCCAAFFLLAAAAQATPSPNVVISEFRARGPLGANDEFVELYNRSTVPVEIGGYLVKGSNNAGTTSTRATIPTSTLLNPGCHYLLVNSNTGGYSGTVPGDRTYSTGVTDDGGIALTLADGTIVDQVGMSAGSAYKEGTPLTSVGTTNVDHSYSRAANGADTDNNSTDLHVATPSDPQNNLLSF